MRVVRCYRPDPITTDHLDAILAAGRWTGSSKNRQGWAFVVITSEERRRALAGCGRFSTPMLDAPLVIAPVKTPDGNDWDMGRLAQNMMLTAWARGIGSCPITLHDTACAARELGIPSGHHCKWVMAFGYVDEEAETELRSSGRTISGGRKPLTDLVHHESWD